MASAESTTGSQVFDINQINIVGNDPVYLFDLIRKSRGEGKPFHPKLLSEQGSLSFCTREASADEEWNDRYGLYESRSWDAPTLVGIEGFTGVKVSQTNSIGEVIRAYDITLEYKKVDYIPRENGYFYHVPNTDHKIKRVPFTHRWYECYMQSSGARIPFNGALECFTGRSTFGVDDFWNSNARLAARFVLKNGFISRTH